MKAGSKVVRLVWKRSARMRSRRQDLMGFFVDQVIDIIDTEWDESNE